LNQAFLLKTVLDLLAKHVAVMDELRSRGVLRTENNPTGDVAEYLFCNAFGWAQAPNSAKAFDATDAAGVRYQIKGRRISNRSKSRQLSAIRDIAGFDILAGVLFDHHYKIKRAGLIPSSVVAGMSTIDRHTNSYRFLLRDQVWEHPEVEDVTLRLKCAG
jgi:hypothetical protein